MQNVSGQIPAAYSHCLLHRSHWVRKAETLWGERVRMVCVCVRAWISSHTPNDVSLLSDLGIHGQRLQQATKSDSDCWEGMWIKVQSIKIHPLTLRGVVLRCITARIGLQALGWHLLMWAMIWISGTFSRPWGILLTPRMLGVHSHCHVFNGGR